MLGTIVNAGAILVGGTIGVLLKKGVNDKLSATLMHAMGLFVIIIGLKGALQLENVLLVIFSLAIGGLLGEWIDVEKWLDGVGKKLESLTKNKEGGISKGFVSATLVYCVGSMAIVGSIESGLSGNHGTLFAKSAIDGITAIVFASTLGIGVAFSAFSVFIYQGSITLLAMYMKDILVGPAITDISSVGGLLIMAIGLNMLGITKIKVGNLLPSVILVIMFYVVRFYI
jgi:uncharacterized membrane protein YqgA involved in biofilm formation